MKFYSRNEAKRPFVVLTIAVFSLTILAGCGQKGEGSSSPKTSVSPVALGQNAEVVMTDGTKARMLERGDDVAWKDYAFTGANEIHVTSTSEYEPLVGYGAAMTHSSAYLLETMDSGAKAKALASLFGSSGARFNCLRIPVGTSDYTNSSSFYSLDDTDGTKDYDLNAFSIAEDQKYLIPALKDALAVNPAMVFFAAPWSAPAWMKTNGSLIGGGLIAGTDESPSNEEIAFASYLTKFVLAYQTQGIDVRYLSIENEPAMSSVSYPCMTLGANQWVRLVRLTGRDLVKAGLTSTKILAYDHNVGDASGNLLFAQYAEALSEDKEALSYVAAFGVHCYSQGWQDGHAAFLAEETSAFVDKSFFITEITESQSGGVDFALNLSWSMANVTVGPEASGVSAALYWNAILTQEGKPVLGNGSVCYGVLTLNDDGSIAKNPSYYAMAHVSEFVYPIGGVMAKRVDSYADNEAKINTVSYRRADDALVTVATNLDATTTEDIALVVDGTKMITLTLNPQSAVTIISLPESSSQYSAIAFTSLLLALKGPEDYAVSLSLSGVSTAAEFYLASEQSGYENGEPLAVTATNDAFTFSLQKSPGDYTLYAVDGDKVGAFNLTLPDMKPSILIQDDGTVSVLFGFNSLTSWSSYCDPYGKNIYRSSDLAYSSSAEKVNVSTSGQTDPIYITETSYLDNHPNLAKPYYFLVLTAKSGRETIVSYPLIASGSIFASRQASLTMVADVPELDVTIALNSGFSASCFSLVLKDVSGERHSLTNSGSDPATGIYKFDLRGLEKTGVWYDVDVSFSINGTDYDLLTKEAVDPTAEITTSDGHVYGFKDWEGSLKVDWIS